MFNVDINIRFNHFYNVLLACSTRSIRSFVSFYVCDESECVKHSNCDGYLLHRNVIVALFVVHHTTLQFYGSMIQVIFRLNSKIHVNARSPGRCDFSFGLEEKMTVIPCQPTLHNIIILIYVPISFHNPYKSEPNSCFD